MALRCPCINISQWVIQYTAVAAIGDAGDADALIKALVIFIATIDLVAAVFLLLA